MSEIVRGSVYDAEDPEGRGRLKLIIPSVYGEEPSPWAEPVVPPAPTFRPKSGETMWVYFENGDLNKPIYSSTAEITAKMIEALMVLASRIVVGDPNGQRFELNPDEVIATDIDGQPVFSLSPGMDMFFQLLASGDVVAAINSTGDAVFHDLDLTGIMRIVSDNLLVNGTTLTELLQETPRGMQVFGARVPVVTGITTEFGLMEVGWEAPDDASTRWQMIEVSTALDMGGSFDDVVRWSLRVRFTMDGSKPDLGSQLLRKWDFASNGQYSQDFFAKSRWLPPNDAILYRFLVTVEALTEEIAGVSKDIEFYLTDVGKDPIPNVARMNTGDGDSGGGGGGGGDTGNDDPPQHQHHTVVYGAVRAGTYNDGGGLIHTGSDLTQGYYSGTNGNQKSVIWFPFTTIQRDLQNAVDISKVELYLYANHWYYNAGGQAVIGFHGDVHTSVPGSYAAVDNRFPDRERDSFPKPGGRWVDVTAWAPDNWKSGIKTGVILGPAPTLDRQYYGSFNGPAQSNKPQLRITYTT